MRQDRYRYSLPAMRLGYIVALLLAVVFSSTSVSGELLELTHVPPYGIPGDLMGRVHSVDPYSHRIAVYIYIEGLGWWTKPFLPCTGIPIAPDSLWIANITTSPDDIYATEICAFLLSDSLSCPSLAGEEYLPDTLFEMCTDAACTTRASRTINWSDYDWDVRRSFAPASPDSNYFSDSTENAWVDGIDRLHLAIRQRGTRWDCTEIVLNRPLGYGTYVFQTESKIGALDKNVVLGMFIYDSGYQDPFHREMDIEFARWGDTINPNAQFVVQPWEADGNIYRWIIPPSLKDATHSFHWTSDSIKFVSARGHQFAPPFDSILDEWTYSKAGEIPEPGDERVTLNLWLSQAQPPSDYVEPEVIITSFTHLPQTGIHEFGVTSQDQHQIMQNSPNPFSGNTVVRYQLDKPGWISLTVSDVTGRTIRTLVDDNMSAGLHYAPWDGRDDLGNKVTSGVYFCRLQAGFLTSGSKMILID